jgi:hypothetical protein
MSSGRMLPCLAAAALLTAAPALGESLEGPAGLQLPAARSPSGTAWQPDAAATRGVQLGAGDWQALLGGAASFGLDDQLGDRGGRRGVSTSWLMAMAQHDLLGGQTQVRAMLSLEPLTVADAGYPLLLQSGGFHQGTRLHDRQHPHDFFMEASLTYRRPLSDWLGAELYLAPVGEPALGPPAYMHRASAEGDPLPPISYQWQDSTHVTSGVATAALYTREVKLEASWFNGREPDEDRWDLDLRSPDSFSVRLSANPVQPVSLQVSYGYLASPEPPQLPGALLGVSRVTGSLSVSLPLPRVQIDATAAWGRKLEATTLDSFLFEANFDLDGHNAPFVRLEHVEKTARDLAVPGAAASQSYGLSSAVLGFVHSFRTLGPVEPALGGRISLGWIPADLEPLYGSRALLGGFIYLMARAPRR